MSLLNHIHKHRTLCILIAGLLLATTTFFSLGLDSTEFRNTLKEQSNEELMERGREYYRQSHMDSALIVFSYIGDSYAPEQSTDDNRIAMLAKNNVGIIYAFEYMDYPRGYEILSEALELSEDKGLEDTQAVICHNIVELLRMYAICLRADNVSDRLDEYLKTGIHKAMVGKQYSCLSSLIINALQFDINTSLQPLTVIEKNIIPDTIEGVTYARALLDVAREYQNDNIDIALDKLYAAYVKRPSFSSPHQYIIGHKITEAQIHASNNNYNMAEKNGLEALALADSARYTQGRLIALSFLTSLPVDKKDQYLSMFLQLKDSALSNGQLQMVSEIDFRHSLNREREENKRLSAQRTRLYWTLGLGTLLLIVFGVLIGMLIRSSRRLRERNASLYAKIQEQLAANTPPTHRIDNASSKYAGSSLSQEKMDDIQNKLTELLADDGWICDPDISLAKTASRLNVNTTYLSRAVNERFGISFSQLLNEYRVRIATRRMSKGSSYANQTIESISQSVGYSSRSSFIAAFKKINGMTPSEYMRLTNDLSD